MTTTILIVAVLVLLFVILICAGIVIRLVLADDEKYPGAPACPYCGRRHPLVEEFGACGKCASEMYDDY